MTLTKGEKNIPTNMSIEKLINVNVQNIEGIMRFSYELREEIIIKNFYILRFD
jgi:hypothetical protein